MNLLTRFKDVRFIGRTLARFKMGMAYYAVAMSSVTAVMTFKTAFPSIDFWYIFPIVPVFIIGAVLLGYYLDTSNISTIDTRKTNETTHRFLLTSDVKAQEFQILQTQVILQALSDLNNKKDIDVDLINQKYVEYIQKWKQPDNINEMVNIRINQKKRTRNIKKKQEKT